MTRPHPLTAPVFALAVGFFSVSAAPMAWAAQDGSAAHAAATVGTQASAPADGSRCKPHTAATIADCDAALQGSVDAKTRAGLLELRAYLKNDQQLYESALADLDEAKRLDPANANVLHERGYTLGALARYEEAIEDLNAEIALRPDKANAYSERAFSELPLARFEDVWRDRNKEVELEPGNASTLLARGRAAMWLARFDDTQKDIDAADALAKQQNNDDLQKEATEVRKELALWTTASGADPEKSCNGAFEASAHDGQAFAAPNLIGDCTAAYFKATKSLAKADLLTARSIAWRFNNNEDGWRTDLTIAAALEPNNPDRHVNLGFAYLSGAHSWAAEKEFDKALALPPGKNTYAAYGGRASARFNQRNYDGAFADGKKSFELQPNVICLFVLGDLAMEVRHDPKSAKLYWMGAYRLGSRDDSLMARLKSVGVDDPAKEPDDPPAKK